MQNYCYTNLSIILLNMFKLIQVYNCALYIRLKVFNSHLIYSDNISEYILYIIAIIVTS